MPESRKVPYQIFETLLTNKQTFAIAESCTGGLVQSMVTSEAGISQVFIGGIVSYSNMMKAEILKVDNKILKKFGAVSEECALQMAEGVRNLCHSDWGLSVTGIAGPASDQSSKIVGTVCFALVSKEKSRVWTHFFAASFPRVKIQHAAAEHLLCEFNLFLRE